MALLDDIPLGTVVALDTAPLIYFIEAHPQFGPIIRPLFVDRLGPGLNRGITSVVTLSEVLVQPLRMGRNDLVQQHRDFLTATPHFSLAEVSSGVALRAADLRARYGLRLADAFQIAAALIYGATLFVTNDDGLRRVTELRVLVLKDYLPPPSP